jgi:Fe2+ transport system protein FeoA
MKKEERKTDLAAMEDGQAGTIDSITGGKNLVKRLADLGITKGAGIKVLRRTLFSGPVQVEVCGSRLALGNGLASKIIVVLNE